MTESLIPEKKSKAELEQMVKANGGKFFQTHDAATNTICVADKRKLAINRKCALGSNEIQGLSRLLLFRKPANWISFMLLGYMIVSSKTSWTFRGLRCYYH